MAVRALPLRHAPAVSAGYRRIVVPMLGGPEAERAVEVACRLAAERHSHVTVVTVLEVPPLLPLDAHMDEEELETRRQQARAVEIADRYGVPVVPRRLRARDAGAAVVDELAAEDVELVVLGATRRDRRGPIFGRAVQHVLRKAPCRVLVVSPRAA